MVFGIRRDIRQAEMDIASVPVAAAPIICLPGPPPPLMYTMYPQTFIYPEP